MSLRCKLLTMLKSKKGNALLLATAGAIAATFSVYFFVSLTTLSEDSKQRVAHLYNAYQMGQSLKAKIDGADTNQARLGTANEDDIEAPIDDVFHNGKYISLAVMVKKAVIISADDPTATARAGVDMPYDLENSGVAIKYADADGNPIAPTETGLASDTLVADVQLFVNLAGTPDAASNSPYADGEPFYYILMETSNSGLTTDDITVNLTQFPAGILSTNDGGPQAEVSVVLPQDDEG
ncbi:MAG: hypothetical protein ISQ13_03955 [Candidatus Margulisbacteria bacterium]|nr:hypothetical protein [Candidatus Margulisiibacteriota bacterium]